MRIIIAEQQAGRCDCENQKAAPAQETEHHQRFANAWIHSWFEEPSNKWSMLPVYLP